MTSAPLLFPPLLSTSRLSPRNGATAGLERSRLARPKPASKPSSCNALAHAHAAVSSYERMTQQRAAPKDERSLASLRAVAALAPIKGADRVVVAFVDGWRVVVKKDEFRVGDDALFIEVDSFIPHRPELWGDRLSFLPQSQRDGVAGHRIKTAKIRGTLSQGLMFPLDAAILETLRAAGIEDVTSAGPRDIDAALGVVVFDSDPEQSGREWPHFLRKTSQPRLQNIFNDVPHGPHEATLKLDGQSHTVFHADGDVGLCTRNARVPFETVPYDFSSVASALRAAGRNMALQGELMGPGVLKNREKLTELRFYVFDVFDIDSQAYLRAGERRELVARLGLLHVPVIDPSFDTSAWSSIDDALRFAERPSMVAGVAEGVVLKSLEDPNQLNGSFKVISNAFLLGAETVVKAGAQPPPPPP